MLRVYIVHPVSVVQNEYAALLRPDKTFEVGARAYHGEADQGDFVLDDPAGTLDWLIEFAGHRRVKITEDGSGSEKVLLIGRITSKELDRGAFKAGRGREMSISVEDANADLRGIIVHDFVRPEETGRERVLATLAAYLNGTSSTALNPEAEIYGRASTVVGSTYVQNAGNVSMPAETYNACTPLAVLRACAEFENKRLAVYIADSGALELYYAPLAETAQLNCTLKVSDDPASVDEITIFAPNWIAGPALHVDSDETLSGMLIVHPDGTTFQRRDAAEAIHDRWEEAVYSPREVASGASEIGSLLDARDDEQPRRQFGLRLPASKVHLIKAGMRLEVLSAVASAVDASSFYRIVGVRYSYLGPDGSQNQYNVIVTLETPIKIASTWHRPGWIEPVTWIADGAITADSLDSTPPALPTDLALSSDVVTNSDGSSFVRLLVTLVQPTDADLYGSYVEVTSQNDGADPPVPVWDRPQTVLIGEGQTQTRIDGVQGSTQFWARARAADAFGNFSAFTSVVSDTTVKDAEAPAVPQGATVTSGFRGFGAFWVPSSAADLQFYQMRWAPDLAGVPDTTQYVYHLTTATTVFIGQLVPDITYWFQVRAVDRSDNVATSNTDATAVDYQASPEAGWTDALSVVPTLIGQADMAVNSISAALGHISDLNADQISAGTLLLTPTTGPSAIKVNTSGGVTVIDLHNDGSMKFLDPANPARYMVMDSGQLKFTLDGGLTFVTAMTPDGFYGDAILLGSMPGGHNLVRNSSFELSASVAAPSTAVFTDTTGTPGWKAANRTTALVNLTEGTALTATTLAY